MTGHAVTETSLSLCVSVYVCVCLCLYQCVACVCVCVCDATSVSEERVTPRQLGCEKEEREESTKGSPKCQTQCA